MILLKTADAAWLTNIDDIVSVTASSDSRDEHSQ